MEFEKANLSIKEVAKAMKMDEQSIRVMIQQNVVPWGSCFKRPGSNQYTYLISPKSFYEHTGCKL